MSFIPPHEQFSLSSASRIADESFMRAQYPALFAQYPHPKMSTRYGFTDTYHLIRYLINRGYAVRSVQQTGRTQFGKTLTRLSHPTLRRSSQGACEIAIIDSHDGSAGIRVFMGYLRFACMNGMLLGDKLFYRSFRHNQPDLIEQIILDLEEAELASEKTAEIVQRMQGVQTTEIMRLALGAEVVGARFNLDYNVPSEAARGIRARDALLSLRRRESDLDNSLFTVLNVLQENAMRGGFAYTHAGQTYKVQPVRNIDREVQINKAVWNGAMKLLEGAV